MDLNNVMKISPTTYNLIQVQAILYCWSSQTEATYCAQNWIFYDVEILSNPVWLWEAPLKTTIDENNEGTKTKQNKTRGEEEVPDDGLMLACVINVIFSTKSVVYIHNNILKSPPTLSWHSLTKQSLSVGYGKHKLCSN